MVPTHDVSEKDSQLIRKYLLGQPLHIYDRAPLYLLFIRIGCLIVSALCILYILDITIQGPFPWPVALIFEALDALLFLAGTGFGLMAILPHSYQGRLFVCEAGLLDLKKILWWKRARVVYWKNIRSIRGPFYPLKGYRIAYERKKVLEIPSFQYQQINELLALIREQVAEAESEP